MTRAMLAAVLAVAGCATQSPTVPLTWHTVRLGLCEDYPEETRTIQHARQDLAVAHESGAQVLRVAFGWDGVESAPGKYDWGFWDEFVRSATDDFGLTLIPYVCYTPQWAATDKGENCWRSPPRDPADFARFMTAIVTRYRSRIHSWELWNEPDNRAYWLGNPEQFAALVRAGSAAVRAADPHATVVLGGIAGEVDFLRALLVVEHVGAAVDVVNVHSYFETWHPNTVERLPAYLADVRRVIADSGGRQPIWMAETGYSTVGPRPEISSSYRTRFDDEHTEDAQAAAVARIITTVLATTQVDLLAWYRINDLPTGQEVIGDDNNRHLGLRRIDGSAKPALAAFSSLAHRFAQPYAVLSPAVTVTGASADGRVEARAFQFRDGRRLVVAWLAMSEAPPTGPPRVDERAAHVVIALPDSRGRLVTVRDARGRLQAGAPSRVGRDGLALELRAGEVSVIDIAP